MKVFLLALCSSLLIGCTAIQYVEPQDGPRARVRFATNAWTPAVLRTYGDASCKTNEQEWLRVMTTTALRPQPKRLGIALWTYTDSSAKEIYVPANQVINAMFFGQGTYGRTSQSCAVPFSYTFSAGKDYEIFFDFNRVGCAVIAAEIVDNSPPEKKITATFLNRASAENTACMDAFKKIRMY